MQPPSFFEVKGRGIGDVYFQIQNIIAVKYVKGALREISLLITAILRMITQIFLYFNRI